MNYERQIVFINKQCPVVSGDSVEIKRWHYGKWKKVVSSKYSQPAFVTMTMKNRDL